MRVMSRPCLGHFENFLGLEGEEGRRETKNMKITRHQHDGIDWDHRMYFTD